MKIGFNADLNTRSVDDAVAGARAAEKAGFDDYFCPGGWRDTVTLLTCAGREVPRIGLGSSIVSIWGIKPVVLAEQALTVNQALGGRFILGLGLSHFHMVEGRLGMKFERPIRYMREYLTILRQAMETGKVDFDGEMLSAHTQLKLEGTVPPRVLFAALGPQAVKVAGAWSDGTITFMVTPRTHETMTVPVASAAAKEAGRQKPWFCVSAPVCVTNNPEEARAAAAIAWAPYGNGYYPSYRAALDQDGVKGPEDAAIIGDEATVLKGIERYRDAGADEFIGIAFGKPEDMARTNAFLATLSEYNGKPIKTRT